MQELNEEIVLLRMLTAEPVKPTRNILTDNQLQASSIAPSRTLSFATERDIVDNLAFLSATTDDPEKVTAICLEEGFQSESCTIRIAINYGNLSSIAADFQKLAQVLERADRQGHGDSLNELLNIVVSMNKNRILSRLRSKHAKSSKRADRCAILPRLRDMVEGVCSTTLPDSLNAPIVALKSTTTRLMDISTSLETLPTSSLTNWKADDILLRLLQALDDLPSATILREIFAHLPVPGNNFQGQETIVMTLTKLRKYRAACDHLGRAAKHLNIFRHIEVGEVKVPPMKLNPLAGANTGQRFSRCLKRIGLNWGHKTEERFGASLPQACARFGKEMASLKPKVHAEIQLLFHYEINPVPKCPRVICSSKSACFLCNLFIRLHGKFFVERTHGVLYPKWTLPNIDHISASEGRQAMYKLVREFRHNVQSEIRKNLGQVGPKRTHPSESVTSLRSLQQRAQSDQSIDRESAASKKKRWRVPLGSEFDVENFEEPEEECENGTPAGQMMFSDASEPSAIRLPSSPPTQTAGLVAVELQVTERSCDPLRSSRETTITFKAEAQPKISQTFDDVSALSAKQEVGTSSTSYRRDIHLTPDIEGNSRQLDLRSPSQVRFSFDLDCEQQHEAAYIMRDHGSRNHDTPAEPDTAKIRQQDDRDMSRSVGVSRRFDFHELELFFESPRPSTGTEVVSRCSEPLEPCKGPVVNLDGLVPGDELLIDLGGNPDEERVMFLTLQNQLGVQSWWKIRMAKPSML